MSQKIPEGYILDPPEWGSPDSFTYPIEIDPTVPKPDVYLGRPSPKLVKIKPMADLSKPEDFPKDVQAIIESAAVPRLRGIRGMLERAGLSF